MIYAHGNYSISKKLVAEFNYEDGAFFVQVVSCFGVSHGLLLIGTYFGAGLCQGRERHTRLGKTYP
jgi:hypothetical protein